MNPYLVEGPAVISFSGGRTSGYMLHEMLRAYGGKLPPLVRPVFCNTGKEREETLQFVERCGQRWDVPITWLEYRWEPGRHYFAVVDYASASRKGEPFELVIKARGQAYLPNPVQRFCTAELKVRTTNRWVRTALGWESYRNAIGLRADEEKRVLKMRAQRTTVYTPTLWEDWILKQVNRGADHPPGESTCQPLYDAGVKLEDVMAFWAGNDFDLQLRQDEGNCDLCFLKGGAKLLRLMADRPESADWWIAQENLPFNAQRRATAATFRNDRPPYAELLAIATGAQEGPGWLYRDKNNGSCGELDECRCTD